MPIAIQRPDLPRIALDLSPLATSSSLRGIGRYVRGLVQGLSELAPEQVGALDVVGIGANRSLTRASVVSDWFEYSQMPPELPVAYDTLRRSILIASTFGRVVRRTGAQILHLTDPKGFVFGSPGELVLTCHDLISLALADLYLPRIPHWQKLYAAIERKRYGRARAIIAVSHATKNDLVNFLGVEPDKITVIGLGVDSDRFNTRQHHQEREKLVGLIGSSQPYVLYVGAGDARKDLPTLIAAYARSRLAREALLVFAGRLQSQQLRRLMDVSAAHGVQRRVKFLGHVDEVMVPALYRMAAVHVFPSRYEGFGLPVLEALACGTPTITSPGSSLDEVAGDAALIVPCGEPDQLAVAIDQLATDTGLRLNLRQRGLERAAEFSWKNCAQQTVGVWSKAVLA